MYLCHNNIHVGEKGQTGQRGIKNNMHSIIILMSNFMHIRFGLYSMGGVQLPISCCPTLRWDYRPGSQYADQPTLHPQLLNQVQSTMHKYHTPRFSHHKTGASGLYQPNGHDRCNSLRPLLCQRPINSNYISWKDHLPQRLDQTV